ncbi:hypothetical protein FB567DRAFT_456291 [Paraphoma chrysanthemicola]|uniref:Uncharacterized protein n=1 Tax=Paraphoma chrysanthemicola TaxID=798071 RepID=A0A8K0QSR2_9PLEO|nr:hypothetical protein FB567DRAFT_456291 [Paraphoma chrysanthemicola]
MASADDAHSRPKRPTAMARQSSAQSHVSQSPSETHHRPAQHKAQRHHVVGQRVQRNTSFGKNLNKLNKAAQQMQQAQQAQQAADKDARHHRRSQSGNSVSAPSSPRPSFKRNASSGGIVRAANQATKEVHLRKNHSSGHLARHGQPKHALKSSRSEIAPPKKSLAHPRSRQASPEAHPSVHFDVGDEEEAGDDGWTEESASQSPTTTRSNTRSNSVILDAQHKLAERNMENNRGEPPQTGAGRAPPTQATNTLPDRTHAPAAKNGGASHHSRPPDADMITSRLLQRSASHTVPPQTTSIAASVGTSERHPTLLSHSAGSTLVDTPGKDLVSRFMDGDGSAGTPHDGGYMSSRKSSKPQGSELDQSKRNKSMPNVSGADTPNRTPSRSGATTPTNLPPSRTQQKLMLQRASSNIEPQKLVPVTLPRTGGPTFLQSGIHYNANGEGRLDPRLQQQFNHVAVEYRVVRRYRNPLADSVLRIQQMPGMSRKTRISKTASSNGSAQGGSSLSTSFNEAGIETDGASSRRSARVSFDGAHSRPRSRRDDGDVEGRQSFESDHAQSRNEAEDICRRLWESAEIIEAD